MNISDVDLKLLWAKAAGRCSFPGCPIKCVDFFEHSGDAIIGEMAHVIPQSSDGPRGQQGRRGPDTYSNLILLCPTHHTIVDKAPADHPSELLHQWKRDHESRIEQSLNGHKFPGRKEAFECAAKILIENRAIHQKFGPESAAAKINPLSEGYVLWSLRKLDTILPNNRRLINLFETNERLYSVKEWEIFVDFREHALAFERNTIARMDREVVPRFPAGFEKMIQQVYAQ